MKTLFLALFAVVFALGLGIPDAEAAKRFGGGGSFGMQRQTAPQTPRQPAAAPQQSPQGAAQPQRRGWMGPIAGLAAGLGLAALFSHLGLGEEMASFVLIALMLFAALMLFRRFARRGAPAPAAHRMEYAGATPRAATAPPMHAGAGGAAAAAAGASLPAGFDAAAFAREAKLQFIRLQAANDAGNLDDIREFTTPEVFAEIHMQLAERGAAAQRTEVVDLAADVIDVADEPQRHVVSVRFRGLLREDADAAPAPFDEVWHLTKPKAGSGGWVVAGIQQIS